MSFDVSDLMMTLVVQSCPREKSVALVKELVEFLFAFIHKLSCWWQKKHAKVLLYSKVQSLRLCQLEPQLKTECLSIKLLELYLQFLHEQPNACSLSIESLSYFYEKESYFCSRIYSIFWTLEPFLMSESAPYNL